LRYQIVINAIKDLATELLGINHPDILSKFTEKLRSLFQELNSFDGDYSAIASYLSLLVSQTVNSDHWWADLPNFTWRACILISSVVSTNAATKSMPGSAGYASLDPILACYPGAASLSIEKKQVLQSLFFRLLSLNLHSGTAFDCSYAIAWHVSGILALNCRPEPSMKCVNHRNVIRKIQRVFNSRKEPVPENHKTTTRTPPVEPPLAAFPSNVP